jgi:hypothetical protein
VLNRYCWLFVLMLVLPLRGQDDGRVQPDGPIQMTPDLALAIPLVQVGRRVTLKFPVLINRTTVLKPGMALRSMYIPPNNDQTENLNAAHVGTMAESFTRNTNPGSAPIMPSYQAHQIEKQRRVEWEVPVNFQLAMAQLATVNLHLIYSPTGDNRNLEDTRLDFYEGLLLGSPTGKVTVLAVEIGSKADKAGFKAGDDIVSIDGTPMPDNLESFPPIYVVARQKAQDDNAASFQFVVRSAGQTRTLDLAMPPRIKSMLMQGF